MKIYNLYCLCCVWFLNFPLCLLDVLCIKNDWLFALFIFAFFQNYDSTVYDIMFQLFIWLIGIDVFV